MSFARGEKVHTHDGKVRRVRKDGTLPKMGKAEIGKVRGFVRCALQDEITGEREVGDWWENQITYLGYQAVIRGFAGLAYSASSVSATVASDMAWARYIGVGNHTAAATANSDLSLLSILTGSEWGSASTSGANSGTRMQWSLQSLSATQTLNQTHSFASSHISHSATLNCVMQFAQASITNTNATQPQMLSIAMFNSSTKGTTQALTVTYNWVFST